VTELQRPQDRQLRVAVVGYGFARMHAQFLAALPEYQVAAIVARSTDAAAKAAKEHPEARIHRSVDDLVADADAVDLVVVGTRDDSHFDIGMRTLRAGLPTVIDKPLAPTSAQTIELQREAAERNVPLVAFQNKRWDADFRTVASVVDDGVLGEIIRYEAWITRWMPAIWDNWREQARPGTVDGPLADIGSHMVDQAVALFGPVDRVVAELDRRRPGTAVPDDIFLALTHRSGVRTHLHIGAVTSHPTPTFQVQGMAGSLVTTGQDGQFAAMIQDIGPLDPRWGTFDTWTAELRVGQEVRPVTPQRSDAREFYRKLAKALHGNGPLPVDPADTLHVIRILEAAQASAAAGGSAVAVTPP
jgi:predicted dehydrogenase